MQSRQLQRIRFSGRLRTINTMKPTKMTFNKKDHPLSPGTAHSKRQVTIVNLNP